MRCRVGLLLPPMHASVPVGPTCQWIGNLQPDPTAQEKTPVLQGSAAECDVVPVASVPPEGLEPSTY